MTMIAVIIVGRIVELYVIGPLILPEIKNSSSIISPIEIADRTSAALNLILRYKRRRFVTTNIARP